MQFVGESFWEYIWLVINKNIKTPLLLAKPSVSNNRAINIKNIRQMVQSYVLQQISKYRI